jgi:hypothetical protein
MKSAATSIASLAGYNETEDLNEVTSISRVLLAFLLTAFLLCVSVLYFIPVPMVYAHGGQGVGFLHRAVPSIHADQSLHAQPTDGHASRDVKRHE